MFCGSCFFPSVCELPGWFSPPLHFLSCKRAFYLYTSSEESGLFCLLVNGSAWICPFCCAKELCSTIICHKELPLAVWGFADIPPLLLISVGTVDGKALGTSHWGYHTSCTQYSTKSEKGNGALERWSGLLKVIPQVCSRTTTEPGV